MAPDGGPPSCGEPATVIFEAYSSTRDGGLHGSLAAAVYSCDEHVEVYRRALLASGLTPYRMVAGISRTCGQVFAFDPMVLTTWGEWSR